MSGINEEKPVSRVRCAQDEFYVVAETILGSYEQRKAVFMLKSTKYTNTTGTVLLTELEAAQALPDEAERVSGHAEIRIVLVRMNLEGLRLMNELEGFVREGFDKEVFDEKLTQAGFGLYAEAYGEVWPSMKHMLNTANGFITANTVALTAGGMPVGFATEFDTLKTDILAKLKEFLQEEEAARQGRDAKIDANNALYDKLMPLCDDGQKYFWNQPSVREEFIYEAVMRLVKDTTAKHRVGGTVLKAEDSTPIVQAEMLLERLLNDGSVETVEQVKTNVEGKFAFALVKNGKYRVTANAAGRATQRKDILVDGGPVVVDFELLAASM